MFGFKSLILIGSFPKRRKKKNTGYIQHSLCLSLTFWIIEDSDISFHLQKLVNCQGHSKVKLTSSVQTGNCSECSRLSVFLHTPWIIHEEFKVQGIHKDLTICQERVFLNQQQSFEALPQLNVQNKKRTCVCDEITHTYINTCASYMIYHAKSFPMATELIFHNQCMTSSCMDVCVLNSQ